MRRNIFVTDTKREEAPMVARGLERLGIRAGFINAEHAYADRGCIDMNANLFEALNETLWSDDPSIRSLTTLVASDLASIGVAIHENANSGERFFKVNGQTLCSVIALLRAFVEPETATPGHLYRIVADPEHARQELERARNYRKGDNSDPVVNDMRRMADSVLKPSDAKPEYWPQFLAAAQEGFKVFDETGPYGRMGEYTAARISDIRTQKNYALFLMTPLHRLEYDEVVISLAAYNVFAACMIHKNGTPVHCNLEEFNSTQIPDWDKKMNTLRGLSCSAELYVQSKARIEKNHGEISTRQILDNCDVTQWNAFDTLQEAEECSRILGEKSAKEFDASIDGTEFDSVRFGLRDTSVPVMSPQQLMAMPKDETIIRVRGMRPIKAKKLPYWSVAGLRDFYDANPLEGQPPRVRAVAKLRLSKKGVKLVWPKPSKQGTKPEPKARKTPFVTLSSFSFLFAWAGIHAGLVAMDIDIQWWIERLWNV